jgi:antagonist of KipI
MDTLLVRSPGLSTTIQDLGRHAGLDLGIPRGGAADLYSHRLANAIVGNPPEAATLEAMLIGPLIEVLRPTRIAVTGAAMALEVNGEIVNRWRPIELLAGDTVRLGKAASGCFCYLAVGGGVDGLMALGSRSTYLPGRLGGYFGRALRAGDLIRSVDANTIYDAWEPPQGAGLWPLDSAHLRFIRGPQAEYFSELGYATFSSASYEVTPRSNRIAYRLAGPAPEVVAHPRTADTGSGPTDIVEDANVPGAIQIAGGIEPICMGRDCPTTGAYAKIGCVIGPDLCRLAQHQPGDSVRFREVTIDEAYGVSAEVLATMTAFGSSGSQPVAVQS